ncbi:unnamed protein product [Amoebophrya sp. A120]|nr:unnamed protein product [Amoebophrya sp. A120]|eukprot:GSA120T00008676001.1
MANHVWLGSQPAGGAALACGFSASRPKTKARPGPGERRGCSEARGRAKGQRVDPPTSSEGPACLAPPKPARKGSTRQAQIGADARGAREALPRCARAPGRSARRRSRARQQPRQEGRPRVRCSCECAGSPRGSLRRRPPPGWPSRVLQPAVPGRPPAPAQAAGAFHSVPALEEEAWRPAPCGVFSEGPAVALRRCAPSAWRRGAALLAGRPPLGRAQWDWLAGRCVVSPVSLASAVMQGL